MILTTIHYIFLGCLILIALIIIILAASGHWNTINKCPYSYINLDQQLKPDINQYITIPTYLPWKNILNYLYLNITLDNILPVPSAIITNLLLINCIIIYKAPIDTQSAPIVVYNGLTYNVSQNKIITFDQITCRNMADVLYQNGLTQITDDYKLSFQITLNGVIIVPAITGYCLLI